MNELSHFEIKADGEKAKEFLKHVQKIESLASELRNEVYRLSGYSLGEMTLKESPSDKSNGEK